MLNIMNTIKEYDSNNLLTLNIISKNDVDTYLKSIIEYSIPASGSIIIPASAVKYAFFETTGNSSISINSNVISSGVDSKIILTNTAIDLLVTFVNTSDSSVLSIKSFLYI